MNNKKPWELDISWIKKRYNIIVDHPPTEYMAEMATVGRNQEKNFCVTVNPDRGRNDAYFKVYNHQRYESADKIIRLSFKKIQYFVHKGDGMELWKMDKKELKSLIKYLQSKPKQVKYQSFKSYWELCIWLWNHECGFDDHDDYDESYPEGCNPESQLFNHPQFVVLNQKMPDYMEIEF